MPNPTMAPNGPAPTQVTKKVGRAFRNSPEIVDRDVWNSTDLEKRQDDQFGMEAPDIWQGVSI